MKRFLSALFCFFIAAQASAQLSFAWARGIEGFSNNPCCQQVQGTQVLPYKGSHIYMAGLFNSKADFDPGPRVDSQVNILYNLNSFLSKYDSAGNYLWTYQPPGRGAYALDTAGNIYVAGMFDTTRDFDSGPGLTQLIPTHNDLYLMKLDSNYNLLWAKKAGTCSSEFQVMDLRISPAGEIYVGGFFSGIADFNPVASVNGVTLFQSSVRDGFLVKYSGAGGFLWASDLYGSGGDAVYSIAIDAQANPLITGYTGYGYNVNTMVFKGGSTQYTLITDPTNTNAFVAKYNSSGAVQWAKAARGGDCYGNSIAVDKTGNIFFGGAFSGTVLLDSAVTGSSIVATGGASDAYLAKFSPAGSYLWSKIYGSASDDAVFGLCTDTAGDVYTTGMYSAAMDLNPGGTPTVNAANNGYRDIFIARYSGAGSYKWSTHFGSIYHDEPAALSVADNGALYTTGYLSKSADLNPGGSPSGMLTFLHTLAGQTYQPDAYLARYSLPVANTGIVAADGSGRMDFHIYPNPGASLFTLNVLADQKAFGKPVEIRIINSFGQAIYSRKEIIPSQAFSLELHLPEHTPGGIYTVSIQYGGSIYTQKLVVVH